MTERRIDGLAPCPICGETPRVEREKVSPRKTVYHLHPCCPEVRHLLTAQRRRRGTFYFSTEAQEGPASKYIEPFKTRQQAVATWNTAADEYLDRLDEGNE